MQIADRLYYLLERMFFFVANYFTQTQEAIRNILVASFSFLFDTWLTGEGIWMLSNGLSYVLTSLLFVVSIALLLQMIGKVMMKLSSLLFVSSGQGLLYLVKKSIVGFFSLIGGFFRVLARGAHRTFFGDKR